MTNAIIFDIKHFAIHDGNGIRTTLFFKGCPLRCIWCHNPEGLIARPELAYFEHKCIKCGLCAHGCGVMAANEQYSAKPPASCTACGKCADLCPTEARRLYGRRVSVEEILPELIEDMPFYLSTGGGVTLSGGECLLQPKFCAELLKELKERGINTAVDTCGHVPKESIDLVIPYTDRFLYDIKAIDPEIHRLCTGVTNELILKNLIHVAKIGKSIEIRVPYVPDLNSTQMEAIAKFIADNVPAATVRPLAYHNYAKSKYTALGMECHMPKRLPTDEEMADVRAGFASYGLTVIS